MMHLRFRNIFNERYPSIYLWQYGAPPSRHRFLVYRPLLCTSTCMEYVGGRQAKKVRRAQASTPSARRKLSRSRKACGGISWRQLSTILWSSLRSDERFHEIAKLLFPLHSRIPAHEHKRRICNTICTRRAGKLCKARSRLYDTTNINCLGANV